MVLLVVDTQKAITNSGLYRFELFEHGLEMIVPAGTNSTFDNQYMTAEQSYKYHNEFIWKNRYAECISFEEILERMRG